MDFIIKSRYVASFHDDQPFIIENGMVAVEDHTITEVGKELDASGKEVYDFPNHVLIPGLVNTHTHAAMTLFRGYADDIPLQNWLNDHIWPLEAKLSADQVYAGAKLAAVEALMSGCTTLNSMYWHPNSEAQAFNDVGVRLMLGTPLISGINSVDEFSSIIKTWHEKEGDMIRVALTPHATYTVTKDDFQDIYEFKNSYNRTASKKIAVHTHLAEDKNEMNLIHALAKRFGFDIPLKVKTPTEYLSKLGVLDKDMIAAHCIEMNTKDIKTITENKVGIAINTVSNMKLGNAIPKIKEMLDYTNKIGMGTDGPSSNNGLDIFETMKTTAIAQKSMALNPTVMPAWISLKMATYGGAKVLNWKDSIGSVQVGKKADFAVIDLKKPYLLPITRLETVLSHLVYSATGNDVSDVMINGEWKMRDRELVGINLNKLMESFEKTVFDMHNN